MNQLFAVICLTLFSPAVVDGDTIGCSARIRLTDYDTPEMSGRCWQERALAHRATDELRRQLPRLAYTFVPCATHNYGRLCARATFPDGSPLAEHMIGKGLAAPYVCSTSCPAKRDWCRSP
jgi:micrococcal nuclease